MFFQISKNIKEWLKNVFLYCVKSSFCDSSSVFKERFYFCIFHLLDPDPEGLCGSMRFYTSETDAWFKGLTSQFHFFSPDCFTTLLPAFRMRSKTWFVAILLFYVAQLAFSEVNRVVILQNYLLEQYLFLLLCLIDILAFFKFLIVKLVPVDGTDTGRWFCGYRFNSNLCHDNGSR